MTAGVAFPGLIYVDAEGKIVETFFEDSYRIRPTPGTVLAKLFPETNSALNRSREKTSSSAKPATRASWDRVGN